MAQILLVLLVWPACAAAGTLTTLYRFQSIYNGYFPNGVALDSAGNIYGTTISGGGCPECGVVYRLKKPEPGGSTWSFELVHAFSKNQYGIEPIGPLTIKGDVVFGSTFTSPSCSPRPCGGTVFKLTKSASGGWTYSILHRFREGGGPTAGLAVADDGTVYGTTKFGPDLIQGTIFKIAPDGTYTLLHRGRPSGIFPDGDLMIGRDGAIYGTMSAGPHSGQTYGGAVFRITSDGAYTILHTFHDANSDTGRPRGHLALGTDGTIYGTASGDINDFGGVWSLIPGPTESGSRYKVLYRFDGTGGNSPNSGVDIDAAGRLYGTASGSDFGAPSLLYRLVPSGGDWKFETLHSFATRDPNGADADSRVLWNAGKIYGATRKGGTYTTACGKDGCGTVFQYQLP